MTEGAAVEPLGNVQGFGVRVAFDVEPSPVVKAGCVDLQQLTIEGEDWGE